MNLRLIYLFIISLSYCFSFAQEDTIKVKEKSFFNINSKEVGISVGVDVFNPIIGVFTDKKGAYGILNLKFKKAWFIQTGLGYETNSYDDIGWKSEVSGLVFKLGANYIVTSDQKIKNNMFYIGGKLAYSAYNQEYMQIPIRADNQTTQYSSLPKGSVNSYWLDFAIGARVKLFKYPIYAEAIFEPKILLGGKEQNNIEPIIIPGFGINKSGVNLGVHWGLTYIIK